MKICNLHQKRLESADKKENVTYRLGQIWLEIRCDKKH